MKLALGLLFVAITSLSASQVGGLGGGLGGGGTSGGGTSGGGAGGVGPPPGGATITAEENLVEVWTYPVLDLGVWRQRTVAHTKDPISGEQWLVDGNILPSNQAPAIPTGWQQAPPGSSGYAQTTLTTKFKIKLPIEDAGKKIWVKVSSNAVAIGSGTGSRALSASNGQGDDPLDSGEEMESHGAHLRKVSINDQGEGEWTVTTKAKSTGTGSSYYYGVSSGASLAQDPRSISLPTLYKKKETPNVNTHVDVEDAYQRLIDHPLTFLGSVYANIPKGQSYPIHFAYTQAEREVIEPVSTDALSLKMEATIGFPVQLVLTRIDSTGVLSTTTGTPYRDVSWFAAYAGSPFGSTPIWMTATHNGVVNINATEAPAGLISATSHLLVDAENRWESPYARPSFNITRGESSGTFAAKFDWFDGVDGKAEVKFTYSSITNSVEKREKKTSVFPGGTSVLTFFQSVVPAWQTQVSYNTEVLPGYQNHLATLNVALGVGSAALAVFQPEIGWPMLVIAAAESGLGGYLDTSSDYGKVEVPFHKNTTSRFWKLDNVGELTAEQFDGNPGDSDLWTSILDQCEWRLEVAPYFTYLHHVRDIYNESGFVNRGASPEWTQPAYNDTAQLVYFYHFKYVTTGGGATP